MADEPQIIYEHSNTSGTMNFFTNDLRISHLYENKGVVLKGDQVVKAIDSNRVARVFEFSTILSASDFNTLEGYLRPVSAPDYSTAYPRFTKVYYDNTNYWANVEVICVEFSAQFLGNAEKWLVRLKFIEKTE